MDQRQFADLVREAFAGVENTVRLPEEGVDVPIMDAPIYGFAAADDPIFETFRDPEIIGENYMPPREWMPEARTLTVFYFPFSEEIRSRHRASRDPMDEAWVCGYGNHAKVVVPFAMAMTSALEKAEVRVFNPTWNQEHPSVSIPVDRDGEADLHWSVAWSTRHAAYAAGLGTFGLHRHIITEKGCCGAMVTLLLDCVLEPTKRTYTEPYAYCTRCGTCTTRCPVNAITLEHSRNLKKCSERSGELFRKYGKGNCGKCMVGVPCEAGIPEKTVHTKLE